MFFDKYFLAWGNMLHPEKPIAEIVKVITMAISLAFRFKEFILSTDGSI
jgi:hypothetical protein